MMPQVLRGLTPVIYGRSSATKSGLGSVPVASIGVANVSTAATSLQCLSTDKASLPCSTTTHGSFRIPQGLSIVLYGQDSFFNDWFEAVPGVTDTLGDYNHPTPLASVSTTEIKMLPHVDDLAVSLEDDAKLASTWKNLLNGAPGIADTSVDSNHKVKLDATTPKSVAETTDIKMLPHVDDLAVSLEDDAKLASTWKNLLNGAAGIAEIVGDDDFLVVCEGEKNLDNSVEDVFKDAPNFEKVAYELVPPFAEELVNNPPKPYVSSWRLLFPGVMREARFEGGLQRRCRLRNLLRINSDVPTLAGTLRAWFAGVTHPTAHPSLTASKMLRDSDDLANTVEDETKVFNTCQDLFQDAPNLEDIAYELVPPSDDEGDATIDPMDCVSVRRRHMYCALHCTDPHDEDYQAERQQNDDVHSQADGHELAEATASAPEAQQSRWPLCSVQ
ncbi:hypothetical protein PHYBOEH_009690 [Phytophthora boehmeriae]|uniref:Uncharacterized protein n=1 Tax=Phytophthora boehmeriae TaxID=109152 RepID=A0A8T1WYI0_9STRA|nr:hypothetical protein PHYBOEH_009690 [Phytophthora boehmeriae]